MSDVYLTRQEAAARLRCTPQQVSVFANTGKLRCARVGNRMLFDPADIEAFFDSQTNRRRRRRAS